MSTISKVGAWVAAAVAAIAVAGCVPEGDATSAKPAAKKPAGGSVAGIPANYYALYQKYGGTCPNLDWALLAGIGSIETHHGTYKGAGVTSGANSAGAMGPMQFLRGTWKEVRGKHPDIGSDVYNPANAIPAAAHKLCDDGVGKGNIDRALRRYNNSGKYVRDVKAKAKAYRNAA